MNFDNFTLLEPDIRNIVHAWLRQADQHPSPMQRFINLWMSFNGWATCVTEKDSDKAMVQALIKEPRMRNAFDTLYQRNERFRELVDEFAEWWPIYDARAFRKKARQNAVLNIFNREDVRRYGEQWGIAKSPENWMRGNRVSWADVLWAIYKVRCNLFHGQKGFNNQSDILLVGMCHSVLSGFIAESQCYEWN